jgi:Rps23 Pro-64 3,4-dihydroxylase Tpa1-like proline 4-hydroxylase
MYEFHQLAPNIFYFTNSISEPSRLIDLIEQSEDDDSIDTAFISKWKPWTASNDPDTVYGYAKTIDANYEKIGKEPSPKELYIVNSVIANMKFCASLYKQYNNVEGDVKIDTDSAIKKYNVGTEMGPHADQNDGDARLRYSIVSYLNDDYEGGELAFPNQNVTIKPQAGSIVIFPSSEPYLHQSKKLISGTKYMCPGFWLW